jgi:hypothetical protein
MKGIGAAFYQEAHTFRPLPKKKAFCAPIAQKAKRHERI